MFNSHSERTDGFDYWMVLSTNVELAPIALVKIWPKQIARVKKVRNSLLRSNHYNETSSSNSDPEFMFRI